jgi:hypothetical protein
MIPVEAIRAGAHGVMTRAEAIIEPEHSKIAGADSRAGYLQERSILPEGGVLKASILHQIAYVKRQTDVEIVRSSLERAEMIENETATIAL